MDKLLDPIVSTLFGLVRIEMCFCCGNNLFPNVVARRAGGTARPSNQFQTIDRIRPISHMPANL